MEALGRIMQGFAASFAAANCKSAPTVKLEFDNLDDALRYKAMLEDEFSRNATASAVRAFRISQGTTICGVKFDIVTSLRG